MCFSYDVHYFILIYFFPTCSSTPELGEPVPSPQTGVWAITYLVVLKCESNNTRYPIVLKK